MRVQLEYRRATQMVAGMSEFIEATSGRTNDLPTETLDDTVSRKIDMSSLPRSSRASVDSRSQTDAYAAGTSKLQSDIQGTPISRPHSPLKSFTRGCEGVDPDSSFQTAATIIPKALDVDIYFLDASASAFESLVDEPEREFRVAGPAGSASGTADEIEMSSIPISNEGKEHVEAQNICRVLGAALKPDTRRPATPQKVSPQFLRTLLRRYQRGKTWTFDEDGVQVTTDVSSADSDLSTGSGPSQSQPRTRAAQSRSERKRRRRMDDATTLNSLFPGARSIALVPMWSHAAEKWIAGTVLVTHSPLRTFSNSDGLNYITAFCDVILADVARQDVETTLHNKMAFASSITHELRTPLHGILGTVEHLYDEVKSSVASKMVAQIELCGKTLLDVIDHVLDFSEVNQHTSTQEALDPFSDTQQSRPSSVAPPRTGRWLPGNQPKLTDVPLDAVTEQVIDAITYSHLSTFDQRRLREYRVSTIIDIDHALDKRWQCRFPASAWKRVCMNLVGNALKYTSGGYIHISLKQRTAGRKGTRRQVVFSVQDTGKGMSQAFMTDSLFQAFAQESSFSEGAGLGVNVVAKIVRAMGGKVDLQSSPGKGTIVTVVVPVDPNSSSVTEQPAVSFQELQHVSIRLLGNWDPDVQTKADRGRKLLRESIKKHLEDLGVMVRSHARKQDETFINLIFEADMLDLFSHLKRLEEEEEQDEKGLETRATQRYILNNPEVALSAIHSIMQQLQQIRADARTPPPQLQVVPNKSRSLDILIVDDNEINVQLLQMYCQKQGHRSQTAADGQQAVDSYTASMLTDADASLNKKYTITGGNIQRLVGCQQVILMDINMPNLDGFQATQLIRAVERKWADLSRRAFIVAMTGLGSPEVKQRAFASGIDLFFQKPVKLRELTRVLEERFPVEAG
ncbi:hypothetical protein PRZ48_002399 [Zasmidium cellare]|uniref:Uncharacterized protein n=1 Tax=Zasmidium cellare TaxID=395010 RepID=A0ABR0F5U9_ZASCE|nr:hypothetical protein PRZ48_002399 [Zasmidium cellare]